MSINHAVKQPINILIVDDNEIDIEAVQRAYELLGRKRPSFKRALVGQLLFPFYPLHSTDFVHTHELSCH